MTSTTLNGNRLNGIEQPRPVPTITESATAEPQQQPDREWTNAEIVADAFDRVALGFVTTPAWLFNECRFRGLTDDEIREVLMQHEAIAFGDEGYKAAVSGDGQYYIERNIGSGENASMRELLNESADEIETPTAVRKNFRIADELRAKGIELAEREAVLLQVCHTISKGFRNGEPIPVGWLKRIAVNYHPEHFERRSQVSSVLEAMASRKVISNRNHQVRLGSSLDETTQPAPSKWSSLTDDSELQAVLVACSDCMPVGFVNRNVAQTNAVRCLVQARHNISRKAATRRIRKLIEAGILESTVSKGAEALRLTVDASGRMTGEPTPAKTSESSDCTSPPIDIEALRERFSNESERKALQENGNFFGEISTEAAIVYEILHHISVATFCPFERLSQVTRKGGIDDGILTAALQELASHEMVQPLWCDRTRTLYVELNASLDHCRYVTVTEGLMQRLQAG